MLWGSDARPLHLSLPPSPSFPVLHSHSPFSRSSGPPFFLPPKCGSLYLQQSPNLTALTQVPSPSQSLGFPPNNSHPYKTGYFPKHLFWSIEVEFPIYLPDYLTTFSWTVLYDLPNQSMSSLRVNTNCILTHCPHPEAQQSPGSGYTLSMGIVNNQCIWGAPKTMCRDWNGGVCRDLSCHSCVCGKELRQTLISLAKKELVCIVTARSHGPGEPGDALRIMLTWLA